MCAYFLPGESCIHEHTRWHPRATRTVHHAPPPLTLPSSAVRRASSRVHAGRRGRRGRRRTRRSSGRSRRRTGRREGDAIPGTTARAGPGPIRIARGRGRWIDTASRGAAWRCCARAVRSRLRGCPVCRPVRLSHAGAGWRVQCRWPGWGAVLLPLWSRVKRWAAISNVTLSKILRATSDAAETVAEPGERMHGARIVCFGV